MRPAAAPAKMEPTGLFAEMSDTAAKGDGLSWENLTETEKSAASLGVDPGDFKPIAFMS